MNVDDLISRLRQDPKLAKVIAGCEPQIRALVRMGAREAARAIRDLSNKRYSRAYLLMVPQMDEAERWRLMQTSGRRAFAAAMDAFNTKEEARELFLKLLVSAVAALVV